MCWYISYLIENSCIWSHTIFGMLHIYLVTYKLCNQYYGRKLRRLFVRFYPNGWVWRMMANLNSVRSTWKLRRDDFEIGEPISRLHPTSFVKWVTTLQMIDYAQSKPYLFHCYFVWAMRLRANHTIQSQGVNKKNPQTNKTIRKPMHFAFHNVLFSNQ